jgi:hypothetical protein
MSDYDATNASARGQRLPLPASPASQQASRP